MGAAEKSLSYMGVKMEAGTAGYNNAAVLCLEYGGVFIILRSQ